ncbi:patatin-like phospholipase family protein [Paraburkholderia strydomiana]|uniref:patatin-like phospholipase family protein n=1 Tax=Paraburkholderia strydomiana TaxID=1245417 RepID=UPI001BE8E95C|nr:patatin-like phospholipase family protein [Paraburkholderia strydomiana]MBT2794586.1 patatin-like phospholipase family protein [Paraburkholderia strydomiana]
MTEQHNHQRKPERIALAMQGGGAVGAFQAGVLEALHEANVELDACCGASIGAINAAIFFGNPHSCRVDRLKEFYCRVSVPGTTLRDQMPAFSAAGTAGQDDFRRTLAETDQSYAMSAGLPGFFTRRLAVPWTNGTGAPELASIMDVRPLYHTLESLCDFDELNRSTTDVSVVATNVATGRPTCFDNRDGLLPPPMIVASGSLPPWFAPVEIGGAWYWDGSLSSAAPLHHIVETAPADVQTTILRADLWSPDGQIPDNLSDAEIRQKNIEHGSRAAAYHEALSESQRLRSLLAYALNCIEPARRQSDPQLMNAAALATGRPIRVVPIDYESSQRGSHFKDGQFSPAAIETHWAHGREAAKAALERMHAKD